MMNDTLKKAREILAEVTPLKGDCGRVCGARCCRPLETEETGMLLFPGEEEAYAGKHGALEAAKAGVVDDVIEPKETRKYIIAALEVLANKHDLNLPKKHGNLPL